ncbi:MAG: type II toxin-antitoxin system VapB family antitoxin [Deltaproteobacteria bacterium]|nr:type II toxin-antitoxin system VapB family antitoxin [Deltaproteobacteria bacterium]
MRTNIDIDDQLLEEAFPVSQVRSKKDLIHDALKEYILLPESCTNHLLRLEAP